MKNLTLFLCLLFVSIQGVYARSGDTLSVRYKKVPAPGLSYLWPNEMPEDCPFPQSETLQGVYITGRCSDYLCGDTFYPTWAADGNLYSSFTDGTTDGCLSISDELWHLNTHGPEADLRAQTGQAVLIGENPQHLLIRNIGEPQRASAAPYKGRYPAGTLHYNGVWYYGTYCLGPAGQHTYQGQKWNWPEMGPMAGFRISTDNGENWIPSPHSGEHPLFPEQGPEIKMGAPHFVDFGKNMEHSPDGKAYLLGMGASGAEATDRYANLSWVSGDQVYLARVTPSPETINDVSAYEFFAGHDDTGEPIWTSDFSHIKPLLDWNNRMGIATATWNPVLKKYLMCVTDGWPTTTYMNSYILEADELTGPWRMVTYMKHFGEQSYFLNFPSKFITSRDGRTLWLCHSANFWNDGELKSKPRGGRYGLSLHEIRLLTPDELRKVKRKKVRDPLAAKNNMARKAFATASGGDPMGAVDGVVDGYPGAVKAEWCHVAPQGQVWIRLEWETLQTVREIWLFDRQTQSDQVLSGEIVLDNGKIIPFDTLPDLALEGISCRFPPQRIRSMTVRLTERNVGSTAPGLAEIAVF